MVLHIFVVSAGSLFNSKLLEVVEELVCIWGAELERWE